MSRERKGLMYWCMDYLVMCHLLSMPRDWREEDGKKMEWSSIWMCSWFWNTASLSLVVIRIYRAFMKAGFPIKKTLIDSPPWTPACLYYCPVQNLTRFFPLFPICCLVSRFFGTWKAIDSDYDFKKNYL